MSFRGKLQLKPPSLDCSHANAEPHHTHHETRDNIQVFDDSRGDSIHRLGARFKNANAVQYPSVLRRSYSQISHGVFSIELMQEKCICCGVQSAHIKCHPPFFFFFFYKKCFMKCWEEHATVRYNTCYYVNTEHLQARRHPPHTHCIPVVPNCSSPPAS